MPLNRREKGMVFKMKKLISLVKATMSQDMSLFRYKINSNSSKYKKLMIPLLLAAVLMFGIGSYYYVIAEELAKINLTYIVLTLALLVPTLLGFTEGIYKSQGILFEAKDNDLLFSLPIDKKIVILVKLIKMYVFQFLYDLLFLLPAFVIYIYFSRPGIRFYFVSILITILLPIIPTIIACFLGYIIKNISIKFKPKKLVQTTLTLILFLGFFYLSLNSQSLMTKFLANATSIYDMISKIYYPIGAYVTLINKFDILILLKLLAIHIIPLIIFVYVVNLTYFKIVSKSNENVSVIINKKISYRRNSPMKALILKELKRYFSSTVYMFNTLFGLLLLIGATIAMSVNFNSAMTMLAQGEIKQDIGDLYLIAPKIYYALVILMCAMTSISSSSISIEGKSFNISKSMPIKTEKILLSKIIMSNLICIVPILISDLIFCLNFNVTAFDVFSIITITFIMPTLSAFIGLLANLKYPKMNATSDTEVVKQSMSVGVSLLIGMIIAVVLIGLLFIHKLKIISVNTIILIELIILTIILIFLWQILKKYGVKRYKEIEN